MTKSESTLHQNIEDVRAMLLGLRYFEAQVEAISQLLCDVLRSGHKLLACGNGGSAADASHLATEFVVRYERDRRPFPAISFTTNGGDMTAIGNDYGFEEIFARQVRAFGQKGDIFVALTTSGKSENVRRALMAAKEAGVHTVAFLGRDGGACKGLAEIEIIIEHTVTARIQEAHKLLLHTICEMVEETLYKENKGDSGKENRRDPL